MRKTLLLLLPRSRSKPPRRSRLLRLQRRRVKNRRIPAGAVGTTACIMMMYSHVVVLHYLTFFICSNLNILFTYFLRTPLQTLLATCSNESKTLKNTNNYVKNPLKNTNNYVKNPLRTLITALRTRFVTVGY